MRKTVIVFGLILLIPFVISEESSSSLNWATVSYVDSATSIIYSSILNQFIINVESCIDDPCVINASKSTDETWVIVARDGRKFLWRSEP